MFTPINMQIAATERSSRLHRQAETYRLVHGNTRRSVRHHHREATESDIT